jgi:hypothetical protein
MMPYIITEKTSVDLISTPNREQTIGLDLEEPFLKAK